MNNSHELIYDVAITFLPRFGPVTIRKTIAKFGSAKRFFELKGKETSGIFDLKPKEILNDFNDQIFKLAEEEIKFCKKNKIEIITINDENYPALLKETYDAPYLIYVKGNANFNNYTKLLSVVGTRKATNYGKSKCDEIISEIAAGNNNDSVIVSGLALGIDSCAHKSALKNGIGTFAVLGHGFNYLYPAQNKKLAREIIEKGGALITEYPKDTKPDGFNFVKRNRIIAGMSQGTLIVESGEKGGSLITANLASSYNREVMALPGRTIDLMSEGCNKLIKNNTAALIENAADIERILNWDLLTPSKPKQKQLSLSGDEKKIMEIIQNEEKIHINSLSKLTGIDLSNLSLHLINLEMKGAIKSLPGSFYQII